MKETQKVDSKDVGLEIGLLLGKHIFNTEHLHYGYWTEDLPVTLMNLPRAQEKYSDFLISHIPEGITSILDVGCGVGKFSRQLTDAGYQVDCVSPSEIFAERVRSMLDGQGEVYLTKFEEMETSKKYDLILFSESYQYIDMEKGFEKCKQFLNKPGYILICDFFETDAEGEKVMGGGHNLTKFYQIVEQQPFQNLKDLDITPQTAPTLDVVDQMMGQVGKPIWELVIRYLESNYRTIARFLKWKYKKKIEKINRKYFSGARNGKNFSIFKTYRLMLYRIL